jgi:CAAX protease family protein
MTGHSFFRADGRIRPIWRFFLSVVMIVFIFGGVGVLMGLAVHVLDWHADELQVYAVQSLLVLLLLLAGFKLLTAAFERKPLGSVGLAFCGRWRSELAHGLLVGSLMILVVGGGEWALGLATFSWNSAPPRTLALDCLAVGTVFLVAGSNEELIFRGYPFQRLVDSIGPVGAVALLSALFGAAHLANPSRTWVSTLNTMLVGVPLAIAYLRTRALWLPIGIHVAWNFVQGFVLGLPVSGLHLPASLVRPEVRGALWLTGGAYGPEGGVLTTGVVLLAIGYLLVSKRIYVSKEMRELVFSPVPQPSSCPRGPSPSDAGGHESAGFSGGRDV